MRLDSGGQYNRVINHGNNIFGNNPNGTAGPSYPFYVSSTELFNYNTDSLFVDATNYDLRPLINSAACNGSINPPGEAVGALPCVCTQDSQCIEVYGAGATCDINTGKCVGGTVGTFSPFTKLWDWIKSLLTAKTGNAITGNAVSNANIENLEKSENFFTKIIEWFKEILKR